MIIHGKFLLCNGHWTNALECESLQDRGKEEHILSGLGF